MLTLFALVGAWEAIVQLRLLDYEYLPAPSAVARAARTLLTSGDLGADLMHTLTVTLTGWSLASTIGIVGGSLLATSARAWRYSMASLEMVRAIPPISLVPVALLLFGFSLRMELMIVVYVGIWPILINTIDGVRNVPVELLDVARMLRFSRLTTVRKIVLPAALPAIVVGLRLALSLCLVLAIVAEMIGNPDGLGNELVRAQQALQPEKMFAYVVAIGLLGVALNGAFRALLWRAVPALARAREDRG